jgi:hypothetical protein
LTTQTGAVRHIRPGISALERAAAAATAPPAQDEEGK